MRVDERDMELIYESMFDRNKSPSDQNIKLRGGAGFNGLAVQTGLGQQRVENNVDKVLAYIVSQKNSDLIVNLQMNATDPEKFKKFIDDTVQKVDPKLAEGLRSLANDPKVLEVFRNKLSNTETLSLGSS